MELRIDPAAVPTVPSSARSFPVWIPAVVAGFLGVGVCALTMEYVEGDEAASLLYHALGRNELIQPPLARYQRGLDLLLGVLPADEAVIRPAARIVSFVTACTCTLLLLGLSFAIREDLTPGEKTAASVAFLLAVPELFYLGLLYTPLLAGLSAVLGSHLLFRRALLREGHSTTTRAAGLGAAAVLLVAGGFIRWDLFLYAGVIGLDLVIHTRGRRTPLRFPLRLALTTGAAAGAVAAAAVFLLYPARPSLVSSVLHWIRFALQVPRAPDGWLELLGAHLSVFTPLTVLLTAAAVTDLRRGRKDLLVFAGAIAAAAAFWPLWFSPKELLLFAPALALMVVSGTAALLRTRLASGRRGPLVAAALLFALLPWGVGVQGHHADTAWGPGFAQRPLDRPVLRRWSAYPRFADGLAIPTREGHRPFWGHAYVLFGGTWRTFVSDRSEERRSALRTALEKDLPVIRIPQSGLLEEAELVRVGFTTRDPFVRGALPPHGFKSRTFSRDGTDLVLLELRPAALGNLDAILAQAARNRRVEEAVVTGWAEPLRTIFLEGRWTMTPLGPASAILELRRAISPAQPPEASL